MMLSKFKKNYYDPYLGITEYISTESVNITGVEDVRIYCGFVTDPSDPLLPLELYSKYTFALYKNRLLKMEDITCSVGKSILNKLKPYEAEYKNKGLTYWKFVPASLLNEILKELFVENNNQNIYGGECSVCGLFDPYAPVTNGKCLCYKHFIKF